MPQEPLLFDSTLRENLQYGNRRATAHDIEEALHLAQLDETVRRLPDGIDQRIGPRGGLLSGGERQRVAIARAILQRPAVLGLRFRVARNKLIAQADGQRESELHAAAGEHTFASAADPTMRFTFVLKDGVVTALVLRDHARPQVA